MFYLYFSGTFFTPFLNGFNQFTTRFNPFGRPLTQSQPVFQQFPSSQFQQPQPQRPQQSTVQPNFRDNFQTVRFPNGQVVTQNSQFGVFPSPAPQLNSFNSFQQQARPQQPLQPQNPQPQQLPPRPPFTAFNNQFSPSSPAPAVTAVEPPSTTPPFTPLQSQPPQLQFSGTQPQVFTQQQQRFPPDGAVSSSFGISSGAGSQSTSGFTQSFLPAGFDEQQQSFEAENQQESFRTSGGASSSAIDNTFASFPGIDFLLIRKLILALFILKLRSYSKILETFFEFNTFQVSNKNYSFK